MEILREIPVPETPQHLFKEWLRECQSEENSTLNPSPKAFVLATIAKGERNPSARTLLLRDYDQNGFKLFTNLDSTKAKEIESNRNGVIVFYWRVLNTERTGIINQQVKISGELRRLPRDEEIAYFESEPISAQIRATVVAQSSVVPDREEVVANANKLLRKMQPGSRLPVPQNYGGYILEPKTMEFSISSRDAIGDRISCQKIYPANVKIPPNAIVSSDGGWYTQRLGA